MMKKGKKKAKWVAWVFVYPGRDNGEVEHKIRLFASYGGEAKAKLLPKLQSFLEDVFDGYRGSPRLKVVLMNFNDRKAPSYELRERASFLGAVLRARHASRVFVARS